MQLDPWQELVLRSSMGERSDGTWAAKQVGLSAPRQNGKSQLIVARALAGALLFGETKIVISAHSQDTARETFNKFLEIRDASPALDERIDKVMNALNREFIRFKNGAVIQFKARTVSGSRGFSSDCLLLDEAQILGMPAWVSINSTMSARPNPQIWLMGTPPTPEDNGEVFSSIRSAALGGKSSTLAWLEWAAEIDDDPKLDSTRAKANPAWWSRINHEIVQGEFETYPPERFALDRLGIWDDLDKLVQAMPTWPDLAVDEKPTRPLAIGLAVSIDRAWGSIGAVMQSAVPHLGPHSRARGVDWLVDEASRIQIEYNIPVVIAGRGPAASLIEPLEKAGVNLIVAGIDDYQDACADMFDRVAAGAIEHGNYDDLNDAVAAAAWTTGDRRVWTRKKADVSMLEAVTLALWGSNQLVDAEPSAFYL